MVVECFSVYTRKKCSETNCLHREQKVTMPLGVTGFEPAASWSQTRRSSQAELHPGKDLLQLSNISYCIFDAYHSTGFEPAAFPPGRSSQAELHPGEENLKSQISDFKSSSLNSNCYLRYKYYYKLSSKMQKIIQ